MLQPRNRRRAVLPIALVALVTLTGAACSGGDETTTVSDQSDERPTTTGAGDGGGGESAAYCEAVEQLQADSGGLDLSQDAEGALAGIERMAEAAPPELSEQFDTFLTGIRSLAQLDEDDPNALTAILELMADPGFEAAADEIEQYTGEQCGIDLGATSGDSGDDAMGDDLGEGGIELEDVDAVKDENASSSWADKLNTTVINFGTDVSVSSDADALSADEALEACNALLSSLGMIDSEVTVTVSAGDTELARTENGLCVAS